MAGQDNTQIEVAEPITALTSSAITSRSLQRTQTTLQALYLGRLSRLLRQEDEWRSRVEPDDWRIRLIQRATYSTYRDCFAIDVGEAARDLLRHPRYNR